MPCPYVKIPLYQEGCPGFPGRGVFIFTGGHIGPLLLIVDYDSWPLAPFS